MNAGQKKLAAMMERRREALLEAFPELDPRKVNLTLEEALYRLLLESAIPMQTSKGWGFAVKKPIATALSLMGKHFPLGRGMFAACAAMNALADDKKVYWKPGRGAVLLYHPTALLEEEKLREVMRNLPEGNMALTGLKWTSPIAPLALRYFGRSVTDTLKYQGETLVTDLIASISGEDSRRAAHACVIHMCDLGALKAVTSDERGRPLQVKLARGGESYVERMRV